MPKGSLYFDALGLTYPGKFLLITAMHAQTAGHDIMTFEMLHKTFREQVKSSTSVSVHVEGGTIRYDALKSLRIYLRMCYQSSIYGSISLVLGF
jgi:hypothetical protein